MERENVAIQGPPQFYEDIHLGDDGQLWKWTERGQEVVATSGEEAVKYAQDRGWPEELIGRIRSFGSRFRR